MVISKHYRRPLKTRLTSVTEILRNQRGGAQHCRAQRLADLRTALRRWREALPARLPQEVLARVLADAACSLPAAWPPDDNQLETYRHQVRASLRLISTASSS